ncbi:hypothetical protein GsuE55_10490 [Geobacillus subterraneus]|uniref:Uncharacterized protein n=2 Tax=Anoxybacillaceae TaxID=3120669 RepID=A0A679FR62_9BACL|nr:hypothetical protein GsuE55_10490 [Geobacillus subterraneus]
MGLGQCQLKLNLIEDARKTFLRVLELPSICPEGSSPKVVLDIFITYLTYATKKEQETNHVLHTLVQRSEPSVKYMLW